MKNNDSDLDDLKKARPYLRSAVAFLIFLRMGEAVEKLEDPIAACYAQADAFLDVLTDDIAGTGEGT